MLSIYLFIFYIHSNSKKVWTELDGAPKSFIYNDLTRPNLKKKFGRRPESLDGEKSAPSKKRCFRHFYFSLPDFG
jgi:hypothetical protein